MKIQFEKIGSAAKPFVCKDEGLCLTGTLVKSGYHRVALVATLEGTLSQVCDRCGETYQQVLHSPLKLGLSDEVCKDKEDLDIIEFLDGVIDLTYILESEINLQKSTYHYCPSCDESDEDFEIEF